MNVEKECMTSKILMLTRKQIFTLFLCIVALLFLFGVLCPDAFNFINRARFFGTLVGFENAGLVLTFVLTAGLLFLPESSSETLHRKVVVHFVLDIPMFSLTLFMLVVANLFFNTEVFIIRLFAISVAVATYPVIILIMIKLYFWISDKSDFRSKSMDKVLVSNEEALLSYINDMNIDIKMINPLKTNDLIFSHLIKDLENNKQGSQFVKNLSKILNKLRKDASLPRMTGYIDNIGKIILNMDDTNNNRYQIKQLFNEIIDSAYYPLRYVEELLAYSIEKNKDFNWVTGLISRIMKNEILLLATTDSHRIVGIENWEITSETIKSDDQFVKAVNHYVIQIVEKLFLRKTGIIEHDFEFNKNIVDSEYFDDKIMGIFFPNANGIILGRFYWMLRWLQQSLAFGADGVNYEEVAQNLVSETNNQIGLFSGGGFEAFTVPGHYDGNEFVVDEQKRREIINDQTKRALEDAFSIIKWRYQSWFEGADDPHKLDCLINELEKYEVNEDDTNSEFIENARRNRKIYIDLATELNSVFGENNYPNTN